MKAAASKTLLSTGTGALTQAALNAITNLEEFADRKQQQLEIVGQEIKQKYRKIKGVTGRGKEVQYADVNILVYELVSRYIDNPESFTTEDIKELALIISKSDKYIVISKNKYKKFINERADAATAGLLVAGITSSAIDYVIASLPQQEKALSKEVNLGIGSSLSIGSVLGSNYLVDLITNYKDASRAKRASDLIKQEVDMIGPPRSIAEANDNLTKLTKMLKDTCDSNSIIINKIMVERADYIRVRNARAKMPGSALASVETQRAQRQINRAAVEPTILDTSELDINMAILDNIFLKIDENEKYISENTTTGQKIAGIVSGRSLSELTEKNPFDVFNFTRKNKGGRHNNRKTRKILKKKNHYKRKNKHHKKQA